VDSQHTPASDGEHLAGVSIVIPVYNESERIARSLAAIADYLDAARFDAEVIVADDGSTDDTRAIVSSLAGRFGDLRVLALPHGGKAHAVLAGLADATKPIIGFMDADLATPLETLNAALDRLQNGADLAIGSREGIGSSRIGEPGYRHVMGRVFNGLVRGLLLPGIHDTQCGFKFMTRDARDCILPLVRLYRGDEVVSSPRVTAFDVELLYVARQLDMCIEVLPVTWEYGTSSKVNPIRDTLQNVRDVLQVWLNGRRGLYRDIERQAALRRTT
jgi:glycosyltransferase involved in cell wall biosynthesis